MTYDYNVYFRQNCIVPLFFAVFSLIVFIGMLVSFLKARAVPNSKANNILTIFFTFLQLYCFIIFSIPLFRGGIYLLFEKETDQIQVSGIIEGTAEIDSLTGAKYDTENNAGNGEIVIVNGKKYYLMSYGDFGVGDHVILHVLPRSGFVLKMEMAPPTN